MKTTKTLYDNFGSSIVSFSDIMKSLSLEKASATPLVGMLSTDYGFLQRAENGWKLTELGEKAAMGGADAIKEAFERNSILKDLSNRFGDKNVSPGLIIDHLRKNYKKGANVNFIADRFMQSMAFIKALKGETIVTTPRPPVYGTETTLEQSKWLKIIQLKYALKPPKVEDKKILANSIAEDFKNDNDAGIRSIANMIKKYKDNDEILVGFIDDLLTELRKRHPDLPKTEEVEHTGDE
ncbi:MAG: hypothetical protein V1647_02740 [Pseudomonadota bacterium]